jgi:hypothetical protein
MPSNAISAESGHKGGLLLARLLVQTLSSAIASSCCGSLSACVHSTTSHAIPSLNVKGIEEIEDPEQNDALEWDQVQALTTHRSMPDGPDLRHLKAIALIVEYYLRNPLPDTENGPSNDQNANPDSTNSGTDKTVAPEGEEQIEADSTKVNGELRGLSDQPPS